MAGQFSEHEPPHDFRYVHTLNSGYHFNIKGLRADASQGFTYEHEGGFAQQNRISGLGFSLKTNQVQLEAGDVSASTFEPIPFSNAFSLRGGALTLHDVILNDENKTTSTLKFFGGLHTIGNNLLIPDTNIAGNAFGASWSQAGLTNRSIQFAIFQPDREDLHKLFFSQSEKKTYHQLTIGEGFLWSGQGFASNLSGGIGFPIIGIGTQYTYTHHGLGGIQGGSTSNDSHSYSVGLSEQIVADKLRLVQNFGHAITVSREESPLTANALSGLLGISWQPNLSDNFSSNYLIQDSKTRFLGNSDHSTSQQGNLSYKHSFNPFMSLNTNTIFRIINTGIEEQKALQLSAVFSNGNTKRLFSGTLSFTRDFSPLPATAGNLGGGYTFLTKRLSLGFNQSLDSQRSSNIPFTVSTISRFQGTLNLHARHAIHMVVNSSLLIHPSPVGGDRLAGSVFASYQWLFGLGVPTEPLLKSIFQKKPSVQRTVELRGNIFEDLNNNAKRDKGEKGLEGITLEIENEGKVTTNHEGVFSFGKLEPGNYAVKLRTEDLPPNKQLQTSDLQLVTLPPPQGEKVDLLFAVSELKTSLRISCFEDLNSNQAHDMDDAGLANIDVFLKAGDQEVPCQTSSAGICTFEGLPKGPVTVRLDPENLPADVTFDKIEESINITEAKEYTLLFFAKIRRAIHGHIFIDTDGNSRWGPDDKNLSKINLMIGPYKTTSDSDGEFTVRDMAPGNYPIKILGKIPKGFILPPRFQEVKILGTSGVTEIRVPLRKEKK